MDTIPFATSTSKAGIDARFDALMLSQVAGLINATTWTALSTGFTGPYTQGAGAKVYGPDAGSHTDPVVGGTVPNTGIFAWDTVHSGWQRIASLQSDAMVPINFNQGTINVSSPAFSATQTLNDLQHPGVSRVAFYGIVLNWIRTNIGGGIYPMLQLQTEGAPFFEVSPNGRDVSDDSGIGARIMLFDKVAGKSKSIGIEHQTGSGGQLVLDNSLAVFFSWGGGTPGVAQVWQFINSNRTHFWSDGAWVHESGTGRYEWETRNGGRIAFVGYLSSSAIGTPIDFNDAGQTPTRASPIVSISSEVSTGKLLQFCRYAGYAELSYVDGKGIMHAKQFAYIPILVAALPAVTGNDGMKAYVTDATNVNRRDPVIGGGTNHAEVMCRNGAWEIC